MITPANILAAPTFVSAELRPQRRMRPTARRLSVEFVASPIAIAGLLASLGGLIVGLMLWAGQRFASPPVSFMTGPLALATEIPMALAYSVVGAVLAARRPRNPIGWLFLVTGVTTSLQMPTIFLVAATSTSFQAPAGSTVLLAWLGSSFHVPLVGALLILVFLLFPDGRMLSGRWGIGGLLAVGGAVLVAAGLALDPKGLLWYPSLPNPIVAPRAIAAAVGPIQLAGLVAMLAGLGTATAAMTARYRRTPCPDREPLKWIALAVILLAATGAPFLIARYGLPVGSSAGEPFLVAVLLTASLLPIAAAIGIFRYRLFDVDVVLNHALVYIPLTAFLAGLYAAVVTVFQRVFIALTGDTSDFAVVITTVILAGTFTPVRKILDGFVDRHFKPLEGEEMRRAEATDAPASTAMLADQLQALEERLAELEHPDRERISRPGLVSRSRPASRSRRSRGGPTRVPW